MALAVDEGRALEGGVPDREVGVLSSCSAQGVSSVPLLFTDDQQPLTSPETLVGYPNDNGALDESAVRLDQGLAELEANEQVDRAHLGDARDALEHPKGNGGIDPLGESGDVCGRGRQRSAVCGNKIRAARRTEEEADKHQEGTCRALNR